MKNIYFIKNNLAMKKSSETPLHIPLRGLLTRDFEPSFPLVEYANCKKLRKKFACLPLRKKEKNMNHDRSCHWLVWEC
jgi:hypothetical protein